MSTLKMLYSLFDLEEYFTKLSQHYRHISLPICLKAVYRVIHLFQAIDRLEVIFGLIDKREEISDDAMTTIRSTTLSRAV